MDGDWSGPPGVGWGLCVRDTASGKVLAAVDADRVLATASVGKVLLLIEVALRFEAGTLDPLEPLTRTAGDAVADSGLWQHLRSDTLPAADAAALVGALPGVGPAVTSRVSASTTDIVSPSTSAV